jgi:hypothetical protein
MQIKVIKNKIGGTKEKALQPCGHLSKDLVLWESAWEAEASASAKAQRCTSAWDRGTSKRLLWLEQHRKWKGGDTGQTHHRATP